MGSEPQPIKKAEKAEGVHIKSVCPLMFPTAMGSIQTIVWGLGDDDQMYQWDSKEARWLLS